MSDIDELERRKKELELRRDIRQLERNERVGQKVSQVVDEAKSATADIASTIVERSSTAGKWSWVWVAPLTFLGAYLVLKGVVSRSILTSGIGALLLIPVWLKVSRKR